MLLGAGAAWNEKLVRMLYTLRPSKAFGRSRDKHDIARRDSFFERRANKSTQLL